MNTVENDFVSWDYNAYSPKQWYEPGRTVCNAARKDVQLGQHARYLLNAWHDTENCKQSI